jgi:hypothetical protein
MTFLILHLERWNGSRTEVKRRRKDRPELRKRYHPPNGGRTGVSHSVVGRRRMKHPLLRTSVHSRNLESSISMYVLLPDGRGKGGRTHNIHQKSRSSHQFLTKRNNYHIIIIRHNIVVAYRQQPPEEQEA